MVPSLAGLVGSIALDENPLHWESMWWKHKKEPEIAEGTIRRNIWVHGKVQNVGFRWWVNSQAKELKLCGVARNLPDGRVQVIAEGAPEAVAEMERRLQPEYHEGHRPGKVTSVITQAVAPRGVQNFRME